MSTGAVRRHCTPSSDVKTMMRLDDVRRRRAKQWTPEQTGPSIRERRPVRGSPYGTSCTPGPEWDGDGGPAHPWQVVGRPGSTDLIQDAWFV